jgi:hypothetical protein
VHPEQRHRNRCADVDHDGLVTLRDLALIAWAVAGGRYDPAYDITGNGSLDWRDTLLAMHQLGRSCKTGWPPAATPRAGRRSGRY